MVFLEGMTGACKIEIVPGCWAGSTQPTVNQQSTVIGSWWQFDSFNNSLASCRPDRDCLLSHLPASILMHAASPLPSLPDLPCPTMAWKCGVATHCRSHPLPPERLLENESHLTKASLFRRETTSEDLDGRAQVQVGSGFSFVCISA